MNISQKMFRYSACSVHTHLARLVKKSVLRNLSERHSTEQSRGNFINQCHVSLDYVTSR